MMRFQFYSTPVDSNAHSFADKGVWLDPALQSILEEVGFRIVYGHLQIHRDKYFKRDLIRSATMATLAVNIILSDVPVN